jgi:hypothetical protein
MTIVPVVVVKNIKNAMVKLSSVLLLLISFLFSNDVYSQVRVSIDPKIEEEIVKKNAAIDTLKVNGYRIQIAFNTNRNQINEVNQKYSTIFPDNLKSYVIYQQPYWKLRVGDFYREIESLQFLYTIRKDFPNAFIVPDLINRPQYFENDSKE